ncbi:MAG: ABC transporter permease [Caulobacterales bacterium]|jgi:putative ABC transport system permease protein
MFGNYLAASIRNLQRNGFYAALTVTGLTIGFAAAILIGLYLRHELTYDRFIPGHDRVYLIAIKVMPHDKPATEIDDTSAPLAADLKLDFPQIESVARMASGGFPPTVKRGNVTTSEQGFRTADPDFFKVLPVPAVAGDLAHALDEPDAVVLSRSAARRYFGQDAPLGGHMLINGRAVHVSAVMEDLPSNSHLTGEIFGSSRAPDSFIRQLDKAGYSANSTATYVRLKPGASAAQMEAALPGFFARRIKPRYDQINPDMKSDRYELQMKPLTAIHLRPADAGDLKPGADVKVLGGICVIGILIVVVAAINFVTLMTARAGRRATEVGIRKALGAQRRDLIVQFLAEALIYVGVALVLGIAIAELLLPGVNAALQRHMTFNYLRDPALLATMLGVAAVTGLLAGLYPAFVLSAFRPAAVLKGGPVAGAGGAIVRQVLVVAQFAVLMILLLTTLTIYRQTMFALRDGTGVKKEGVMMLFASPCTETLRDAMAALPGVRGAACASPGVVGLSQSNDVVRIGNRTEMLSYAPVDFNFFEIYGLRPLAGRLPSRDRPTDDGARLGGAAPTVVLNESAARRLGFASPQRAVGRQLSWHYINQLTLSNMSLSIPAVQNSEIVGVVPDFTFSSVRQRILPTFYYVGPKTDVLNSVALNVRVDPAQISEVLPRIDRLWAKINGDAPLQRYSTDQFLLRLYTDNIIQGGFIAVCALVAVSIACLGLFALSAYTSERRTKEIGIRKAMGATSVDILRLLLWQFAQPVFWAMLLALPLGWLAMNWWLRGFAYHVDIAPWTFAAAGGAGVAIALSTVFIHALRVARARPVGALRYE